MGRVRMQPARRPRGLADPRAIGRDVPRPARCGGQFAERPPLLTWAAVREGVLVRGAQAGCRAGGR